MLSYDQAAAKKQWREAVRAVAEAIEDAGGIVNNVNDARLDAVEEWIGESRQWLLGRNRSLSPHPGRHARTHAYVCKLPDNFIRGWL